MSLPHLHTLRFFELRLLRCTIPYTLYSSSPESFQDYPPSSDASAHPLRGPLLYLLQSIESGNYSLSLSSEASRALLKPLCLLPESFVDSFECADRVYSDLLEGLGSFLLDEVEDDVDRAYRVMIVLCVAVAAFLGFSQCNMTGPLKGLPRCPLADMETKGEEFVEWDNWARNQLISAGSDLLGKFSNLQYIVFAKGLLMRTRDLLFDGRVSSVLGARTISWWLARTTFFQQRILDEMSSSLFDLLQVFMNETLDDFRTSESVLNYWGRQLHEEEALTIVSMVHLEAGIVKYYYARVDACRNLILRLVRSCLFESGAGSRFSVQHSEQAEAASGFQLSITGALGFRTVHQIEPKAQMVLVGNANSSSSDLSIHTPDSSVGKDNGHLHHSEDLEYADILKAPKLLDSSTAPPLRETQQAVILANCLLIEKSCRHDEMQRWDMAPYIEAVDSQPSLQFTIRRFCDILRVRWESTRSRTKERALLMMEKLVQDVYKDYPGVIARIPFSCGVYIPTFPALRKEYGELLVRCGLIGEATKIFEELELWDNLILCYRLLEKKSAAVELINARISEVPHDSRLWCSLGDVTLNDAYYEKALEVSNNRSARALRSLARSAYNKGDYKTAQLRWESALALNSLYPDGWFALGAAALKAKDIEKALDGFTRAVQLDPENGEAWNNVACLHMIKKRSKEAFIAFKEALKYKRNSWQLWENYSHVAMDVGNISQAVEATNMVLDLTSNKKVDVELLDRVMTEVEEKFWSSHSVSTMGKLDDNGIGQIDPIDYPEDSLNDKTHLESETRKRRETELMVELLGKVLQKIARSGSGADVWGIYARWHKIKGDLTMCSEALLKQVRSYQGVDLWKDENRFKKFSQASVELCKVYMEISKSNGSQRELFAAEMHLKSTLKQADNFGDTKEFGDLEACLNQVRAMLRDCTR